MTGRLVLPIAFAPHDHQNVLAEVWGGRSVRNFRLAETEKYAHVTYFFNGGVEKEYPCERRLLVPSPKIATYDLQTGNVGVQSDKGTARRNPGKLNRHLRNQLCKP
jgi:bisphosphoglycerate-independent phosphoglycerate mutase (AlkP superfamily)